MVGTDARGELSATSDASARTEGPDVGSVPLARAAEVRTRGPAVRECASLRFARATPADDAAIRRLLRENPTRGAISLSFEREPMAVGRVSDPPWSAFRIHEIQGGSETRPTSEQTLVAYEDDRLVCMGRCSVRPRYLNGELRRVAYLGELRLDAAARRPVEILRGGYALFRELQREDSADFIFTSIASDNHRARRVLERGLPGLPRYEFLTEFVTLLIAVSRAGTPLPAAPRPACVHFLNEHAARHQLATPWNDDQLGAVDELLALRDDRGRILAAAALCDQRTWRQTVVRGYARSLKLVRPFYNAIARFVCAPRLPRVGAVLPSAFLSPLGTSSGEEARLPELIRAAFRPACARGIELLTLGFAANDPRLAIVRRAFRCREYRARLYRVRWRDEPAAGVGDRGPGSSRPATAELNGRLFLPEVALL